MDRERARQAVAPLLRRILRLIAADRGCKRRHLDPLLAAGIEAELIRWLVEHSPGERDTPAIGEVDQEVLRRRSRTPRGAW